MNIPRYFHTRAALVAGCFVGAALLGGCNMDFELPPVEFQIPIATNATVPSITKDGDKLSFDLPEICDLPDLAQLEEDVREELGRFGGLLDIESVTLDELEFDATAGTFDFLDEVVFEFRNDDQHVELSADLSAQNNVTAFSAVPQDGDELDILDMLPGPNECLEGTVEFNGSVPGETVVYNATMHITVRATLHL